MKGTLKIWKGGLICVDADGYAVKPAAGLTFMGVAVDTFDNLTGADGDIRVDLDTAGDYCLPFAGASIADAGTHMYCTDDETITATASTNPYVGMALRLHGVDTLLVRLKGAVTPYLAP